MPEVLGWSLTGAVLRFLSLDMETLSTFLIMCSSYVETQHAAGPLTGFLL